MQLFRRAKDPLGVKGKPFHPSTVVCDFGPAGAFDITAAKSGVVILGATGSGKTSGPARKLAAGYLKADFGGVILAAKPEEAAQWRAWIAEAGREDDLIEIDASGRWRYNFLGEEAARVSEGGGLTINVVALLTEVASVLSGGAGDGEQGGDAKFWRDALGHLLTNLVDLCQLSHQTVTVRTLRELASSAPLSLDQAASEAWRKDSSCYEAITQAATFAETEEEDIQVTVQECASYFLKEWPALADKTRSTIALTLGMLLRPFMTRPLYKIFATDTNVRPEDTFEGKLILVNLPAQTFKTVGVFAGIVWKYCTQLAIMRRSEPNDGTFLRPVFIYADECQGVISDFDYTYQAVARSAGGCTCYITQNREALIANVGNAYKIDSLLANLQTKIFCQNTGGTNEWASNLLGERWEKTFSTGVGRAGQSTEERYASANVNVSDQRRHFVEAAEFTTLRRGGPANDFLVEAILYPGGRVFDDGLPFRRILIDQRTGDAILDR